MNLDLNDEAFDSPGSPWSVSLDNKINHGESMNLIEELKWS